MSELSPVPHAPICEQSILSPKGAVWEGTVHLETSLDISNLLLGLSLKCLKPLAFDTKFKQPIFPSMCELLQCYLSSKAGSQQQCQGLFSLRLTGNCIRSFLFLIPSACSAIPGTCSLLQGNPQGFALTTDHLVLFPMIAF